MSISTHVLDAGIGRPAVGVPVRLFVGDQLVSEGLTDADGRCVFTEDATAVGPHRLIFTTGPWFAEQGRDTFFPEVVLTFGVFEPSERHHVPLLLAPFAYSTYRGS